MVTKNTLKLIHSLEQKKYRRKERLFVAEGPKLVNELLPFYDCELLLGLDAYVLPQGASAVTLTRCSDDELRKASFLTTPQEVLGVFRIPEDTDDHWGNPSHELCLALDGVQDPGNVGTICRIADWFGIRHIYCSPATADIYAPKTVQATMGAIARVQFHYTDLNALVDSLPAGTPVYGTLLDGQNLYHQELTTHGLLVMGNEGNGLTPEMRTRINRSLFIPPYPGNTETSESLNVGVATAILCAEFRRR